MRNETTSKRVARAASKILNSKTASKAEKSVAASALTQVNPKNTRVSGFSRTGAYYPRMGNRTLAIMHKVAAGVSRDELNRDHLSLYLIQKLVWQGWLKLDPADAGNCDKHVMVRFTRDGSVWYEREKNIRHEGGTSAKRARKVRTLEEREPVDIKDGVRDRRAPRR